MKKLTIDGIRESFEIEGYTLLSTEYINNKIKLDFICPNGHRHSMSWNSWGQGVRCGKGHCLRSRSTIEEVRESFEVEGYTLVSTNYHGVSTKLDFICPNGHKHSITWGSWRQGVRCKECWHIRSRLTFEEVKQSFEDKGYTLVSTNYHGSESKLDFICPEGHEHSMPWSAWQQGKKCGKCSNRISKPELELKEYVQSLDIDFISNDRTVVLNQETGRYLELDLWLPDMNKAIEFNGTYWHGLESRINNDKIKKEFCDWKGIDLMIVEEEDWRNRRSIVEETVRIFLGEERLENVKGVHVNA